MIPETALPPPCTPWGPSILTQILPKQLRIYFMLARKLLGKLSKCTYEVLSSYLKLSVPKKDMAPGEVVAVHTFGGFLNFNPTWLLLW